MQIFGLTMLGDRFMQISWMQNKWLGQNFGKIFALGFSEKHVNKVSDKKSY